MTLQFAPPGAQIARPVWLATKEGWAQTQAELPPAARDFLAASGFEPAAGRLALLPGHEGLAGAVFGLGAAAAAARDPFQPGQLATSQTGASA